MFIKSANSRAGTGYTGDVNTAFRQGRQDAFRDYIDNFNFARQADAANNAENQRNVERIADNYADQLQMNKNGRNEVLDFVQTSDKIDGKVLEADINFAARDKLQPRVNEIADDRARAYFFTEDNKANTAQVGSIKSTYELQNAELENNVHVAGQQSQLGKYQYDAEKTAGQREGYRLLQTQMENFNKPETIEEQKVAFVNQVVAIAKQKGDPRSEAEIQQAVLNSPEFEANFRQRRQDEFTKIAAQWAALRDDANSATTYMGGNVPTNGKTKSTQTKEQDKNNWKPGATKYIDGDKATGLVESSVDLGNGFKLSPDGSILKVLPDERVMVMGYSRGDGKRLTVDEATRLTNGMPGVKTGNVTAEQIGKSLD